MAEESLQAFPEKFLPGTADDNPMNYLAEKLDALAGECYPVCSEFKRSIFPDMTKAIELVQDRIYRINVPGYFYKHSTNASSQEGQKSGLIIADSMLELTHKYTGISAYDTANKEFILGPPYEDYSSSPTFAGKLYMAWRCTDYFNMSPDQYGWNTVSLWFRGSLGNFDASAAITSIDDLSRILEGYVEEDKRKIVPYYFDVEQPETVCSCGTCGGTQTYTVTSYCFNTPIIRGNVEPVTESECGQNRRTYFISSGNADDGIARYDKVDTKKWDSSLTNKEDLTKATKYYYKVGNNEYVSLYYHGYKTNPDYPGSPKVHLFGYRSEGKWQYVEWEYVIIYTKREVTGEPGHMNNMVPVLPGAKLKCGVCNMVHGSSTALMGVLKTTGRAMEGSPHVGPGASYDGPGLYVYWYRPEDDKNSDVKYYFIPTKNLENEVKPVTYCGDLYKKLNADHPYRVDYNKVKPDYSKTDQSWTVTDVLNYKTSKDTVVCEVFADDTTATSNVAPYEQQGKLPFNTSNEKNALRVSPFINASENFDDDEKIFGLRNRFMLHWYERSIDDGLGKGGFYSEKQNPLINICFNPRSDGDTY